MTTNTVAVTEAAKTSLRAMDSNIAKVRKVGVSFLALVHDTIIMIVTHSNENGDCTRAAMLVEAMPKAGMRRAGVVSAFKEYGGINVTKNGKTGLMQANRRRDDNGNLIQGDIDALKAHPWYETAAAEDKDLTFMLSAGIEKVGNLVDFIDRRLTGFQKNSDGTLKLDADGKPVPFVTDDLERARLRDLANTLRGVQKQFAPDVLASRETADEGVQTSERQAA